MGGQRPLLSTLSAACFPGPDGEDHTTPAHCKLLTGLIVFSFRFISSRLPVTALLRYLLNY